MAEIGRGTIVLYKLDNTTGYPGMVTPAIVTDTYDDYDTNTGQPSSPSHYNLCSLGHTAFGWGAGTSLPDVDEGTGNGQFQLIQQVARG